MLRQRIITALVLLAVLLPALFHPSHLPFTGVMLALVGAAGWEWGRLNGCGPRLAVLLGAGVLALCALSWWRGLPAQSLPGLWLAVGAVWIVAAAALLHAGVAGWSRLPRALRLAGGLFALWAAWLAAVQARLVGINFLLSVLVLVWVADVCAYFAGRAFGGRFTRRRLAPTISPGKSWEGVWGGLAGVMLLALAWAGADAAWQTGAPSLYTRLAAHGFWLLPLAALFLGAASVAGDLVESLVKRSAGFKDSSGLLPGHGGVLDRVDALLPVLPLALMLHTLTS